MVDGAGAQNLRPPVSRSRPFRRFSMALDTVPPGGDGPIACGLAGQVRVEATRARLYSVGREPGPINLSSCWWTFA